MPSCGDSVQPPAAAAGGWKRPGWRYRFPVGNGNQPDGSGHERAVPHLNEDELLAWRGLLELEARVLAALDAELQDKRGMSISEFDALYQLWLQPGARCRMKDLANSLLVSRGGATKLISRLEAKGLVRRVSQPGLQAVQAELTAAGESALAEAMDTHFDGVRRMVISRLDPAEVRTLKRISERLREPDPSLRGNNSGSTC
jgi:DNA-binding MarR family transcriptional regulator